MSKPRSAPASSARAPVERDGRLHDNERFKDRDEFWLDREAFSVFARQIDTLPARSGFALLLLSQCQSPAVESNGRAIGGSGGSRGSHYPCNASGQQWLRRYCEVKGNVLFYAPHAEAAFEGAYLLEDFVFQSLQPSRALVMGVVPELPLTEGDGDRLKQGAILVGSSRHDGVYGRYVRPLVMLLESPRVAAAWKDTCEGCSAASLQQQVRELQQLLQRERAAASREKEATALIAKQQEIALRETEGSKQTLLLEIERLQQRNQRLQASGEVTEKAAAEFVDQKMHEVSFLQNELATQLAGCKRLEAEVVELREALGASQQKAQQLATENSRLNCRVSDLLGDLEDAKDNPSRFALVMNRLRAANQRAVIENKRLREENISLTQNFHQLEDKFKEKVALIRQVAEMGDAFDLLRKWLTCSERKIRFYEQGYKWSSDQEQEELYKIEELQRAIRVAEAAARSSYISHRAFLLGQQLKACTVNPSQKEVYAFLKCTLDRFGWLFGETEPSQPKATEGGEVSFVRPAGDDAARGEAIYPFGGLEGGPQLNLVADVCVLRAVEKLVPAGEYLKLKNLHALLQLDFTELKELHQQTVDKLVECRTRLRDLKMQCTLNQASADWRLFHLQPPATRTGGTEKANEKEAS